MIYITGDTHGGFQRFAAEHFPQLKQMTRDDYVIICGDFGGMWDGGEKDARNLDWLEDKPFTTLFVDGNHENFDLLDALPVEEWHGVYRDEAQRSGFVSKTRSKGAGGLVRRLHPHPLPPHQRPAEAGPAL